MSIPNNKIRTRNTIEQHEHCDVADARRVKIVDENGDPINEDNPLFVEATISGESKARTPLIVNFSMPDANTEYQYVFPLNTNQFTIRPENNKVTIKYSFIVGQSGVNYDKILPGNSLSLNSLSLNGATSIYFQNNVPGNTLIFKVWTT